MAVGLSPVKRLSASICDRYDQKESFVPNPIAAIILNYNNWPDTLLCLGSVLQSSPPPETIIVVDNASSGSDFTEISRWIQNNTAMVERLGQTGQSSHPKTNLRILDEDELKNTNLPNSLDSNLYLVKASRNRGYAAGNNLGIRLAMAAGMDGVWILNNDTIVTPSAFAAMREALFAAPDLGLCGCLLLYAHSGLVQCQAGGSMSKWTAIPHLCGEGLSVEQALAIPAGEVLGQITYIHGASIMASRHFIESVGLMYEGFFLYNEEQDWAWRGKDKFRLAYAPQAMVYHKEGATTGWSKGKFNVNIIKILMRSRVLLISRHAPYALPVLFVSFIYAGARMLLRRFVRR